MQNGGFNLDNILTALADAVADRVAERLAQATNGSAIRPRLLSIEQGAAYLGRSEEAMRHLIQAGKIPTVRADRRIYIDIVDLDRWIEHNKQAAIE
jgi:excisionase family DNA binding protein